MAMTNGRRYSASSPPAAGTQALSTAIVLHYAQEIFEGLKSYRWARNDTMEPSAQR
ncbi:hypothetical protein JHV675_52340 [Mycobacterium avium subsp. hominissuis]